MVAVPHPLILVVEDDRAIATLLCEVLEEHGYHCMVANGADAALTVLETVRPALITLDLGLPGVSGRTLLMLLRAQEATSDLPVIIVSAERVIEAQLRANSQAVLAKPFDLGQLVATIQWVLGAYEGGEHERAVGAAPPPVRARVAAYSPSSQAGARPDSSGHEGHAAASD